MPLIIRLHTKDSGWFAGDWRDFLQFRTVLKTIMGQKRKCAKNENTENENGLKLANLQFRRRKRNFVGLYKKILLLRTSY